MPKRQARKNFHVLMIITGSNQKLGSVWHRVVCQICTTC